MNEATSPSIAMSPLLVTPLLVTHVFASNFSMSGSNLGFPGYFVIRYQPKVVQSKEISPLIILPERSSNFSTLWLCEFIGIMTIGATTDSAGVSLTSK
ncbi:hypothetical protein L208DRAFT_1387116 [Tricholoma matsutake]|nr:hypothetical protein L208DRAFT_1387116 [Tricholoma matsutake 945]